MSRPAAIRPGEAPPTYDSIDGSQGERDEAPNAQLQSHDRGRAPPRQNSVHTEQDIAQETRQLPPGWLPQYDASHDRFFFVDTRHQGGPRSIWVHPLDDPQWLSTVPRGVDPFQHVENLWNNEPEPTPEPRPHPMLPGQQKPAGIAQQLSQQASAQGYQSGASYQQEEFGIHGPGVRQGNTQGMQQVFPGTTIMHNGQQVQRVTMEDLINYELSKMGSPEEYERNNPPGKISSKMFHRKETARQRQHRHAEARARDLADRYAYRAPLYDPMMRGGYPGYGRGYGGYGGMYPGMGLSAGMLGLGGGMLLGGLLF